MLNEIYRILAPRPHVDENAFTDLSRVGIELKRKSNKHISATFYQDSRYKITNS